MINFDSKLIKDAKKSSDIDMVKKQHSGDSFGLNPLKNINKSCSNSKKQSSSSNSNKKVESMSVNAKHSGDKEIESGNSGNCIFRNHTLQLKNHSNSSSHKLSSDMSSRFNQNEFESN